MGLGLVIQCLWQFFSEILDLLLGRDFTDTFDFAIHNNGRGSEDPIGGDLHRVGHLAHVNEKPGQSRMCDSFSCHSLRLAYLLERGGFRSV